jgi:hypothetical protein
MKTPYNEKAIIDFLIKEYPALKRFKNGDRFNLKKEIKILKIIDTEANKNKYHEWIKLYHIRKGKTPSKKNKYKDNYVNDIKMDENTSNSNNILNETNETNLSYEELKKENEEFKKENEELKKENEEFKKLPKHGSKIHLHKLIKKEKNITITRCPDFTREKLKKIGNDALKIMKDPDNYSEKFASQGKKGKIKPIESLKFPLNEKGKVMRKNECGNYMEGIIDIAGEISGEDIILPSNEKGKKQSVGYPDRELKKEAYLEIKIFDINSKDSSLRSFYLSVLTKVNKEIPHVLIGFAHKDGILIDRPPEIIDLYDVELTVKIEYNASNKDIYNIEKIPPNYTIEQLNLINGYSKKCEKRSAYSKICKKHNIKCQGATEILYKRLIEYFNDNLILNN